MGVYSIKDLEKISGIKAHTIRIWERRYNIVVPSRTETNIRLYSDIDLRRLLNIAILNKNGFKISHIAHLGDDILRERVLDLCLDVRKADIQIESLMISMLELNESKFNNVLTHSIIKRGFECTVEEILFPFLDRIGILWQAGSITPAQEHFISNLIRQKLIVAIDNEMENAKVDKLIVFFLVEGEVHELGLLFYSLIARKEGFHVLYLGGSVPLDDLIKVNDIRKADAFFSSFISTPENNDLEAILLNHKDKFPNTPFFVNGLQIKNHNKELPQDFMDVSSVEQFKKVLKEI